MRLFHYNHLCDIFVQPWLNNTDSISLVQQRAQCFLYYFFYFIFLRWTWRVSGTLWENPLISTLFLASSHMSQELNFHTWVAMLYSSIRGSYKGSAHAKSFYIQHLTKHISRWLQYCSIKFVSFFFSQKWGNLGLDVGTTYIEIYWLQLCSDVSISKSRAKYPPTPPFTVLKSLVRNVQ